MKILVYGAGITGSLLASRLHEAGHGVALLARGERLHSLRLHGVQVAEGDDPSIRSIPVPVVEHPDGAYDLIAVCVRTHQVDTVLESLSGTSGDVVFLLNWAAGAEPLMAELGRDRVLLGFATEAGTWDGGVIRSRPAGIANRLITMPFGEPDGRTTARLERVVGTMRSAGIRAGVQPRMDAWLTTHAAFEVPLGQAVKAAGGLEALAADTDAIRNMVRHMRRTFGGLPARPLPSGFGLLLVLPEGLLVPMFRAFLRGPAAGPLGTTDPAAAAELDKLAEQLGARAQSH